MALPALVGNNKRHQRLELEFWRVEEDKINTIEDSLADCNELTNGMIAILNEFEEKLVSLETTMLPIHKHTQDLAIAQKNIDAALSETDKLIHHTNVASESDDLVNQRSITSDYKGYLEWTEAVHAAIVYFQNNSQFKNSEKLLKKLRDLNRKAVNDCEAEFERCTASSSKPTDLTKVSWPFPSSYELIPSATLSRLARIAQRMQISGSTNHVAILQKERSATLKASLKKAIQDGVNPNKDSDRDEKLSEEKVGRYKKGTHRTIFHVQLFLRLLEMEHQVFTKVLIHTGLSPQTFDKAFSETIEAALDYFHKKMAELIKDKSVNRVLILLDVLENLQIILPKFRSFVTDKTQLDRIMDLRGQVTASCKKAISEYREYVLQYNDLKNTQQLKDGTLYNLTIETYNFVKRLLDYRGTIDSMPPGSLVDEEMKTPSAVTCMILLIFNALERNLEAKAKAYKKVALSQIFLLNNYHYILKHTQREKLPVDKDFISKYENSLKTSTQEYKAATWDKCLQYINAEECKALADKCAAGVPSSVKKTVKAKFKGFNDDFTQLSNTQRTYSVPDPDLRSQLRNGNVTLVVEKYKNFVSTFENLEKLGKYVQYPPRVLENMLNNFFDEHA